MAAAEHVEETCGKIKPEALTQKLAGLLFVQQNVGGNAEQGRNGFLACAFVAGSGESEFEGHRKTLADDHAVTVMQVCLDSHDGGGCKGANHAQVDLSEIKCFCCEKMGHTARDCPEKKKSNEEDRSSQKSTSHLSVSGITMGRWNW